MNSIASLQDSLQIELKNILSYWEDNTIDNLHGGFIGHIDYPDIKQHKMNKGIILNSRILWSFSAAANHYKNDKYAAICKRSYNYLKQYFNDEIFGGLFWEVDYLGTPTNKRKQVYAQAFTIYALSEYYLFSKDEEVKNWAITLFNLIEEKSFDNKDNGYIEAFAENWDAIEDMRLSEKDENYAKTMNTHLHILEAYTTFYKIHPEKQVKDALINLITLFTDKFLSKDFHFHLFFDEKWTLKSSVYSYGHDVETAWLLIEAAKVINEPLLLSKIEQIAVKVVDRFIEVAIDEQAGTKNCIDLTTGIVDTDRHWWPQAEAMVGIFYVYKITGDEKYHELVLRIWDFIDKNVIDHTYGEWLGVIDENGNHDPKNEKVGMWKCPYHNSRACIQIAAI